METLEACPICDCKESVLFITTKDFLLTQEAFKIVSCQGCGFKYTNPRPNKNRIGEYYKFNASVRDKTKEPFGSIAQKANTYKWLRIVSSFYKTGMFLDVGYETTAFMDLFKFAKWNTSGVSLKQLLEKNSNENTVDEESGRGALNGIESESIEVISLWHSLEKIPNLEVLLTELKRILKPNGLIIIATSNPTCLDADYFKEYWEGYNVPRNLYHFSPQDMDTLFRKHEMKVFRTLPLVYDTYSNSFWSEQNKSGKASSLKAFLIGLRSNIAAIKSGKSNSGQVYLVRNF
jgi:predicted SAM-dependent methyltransferase